MTPAASGAGSANAPRVFAVVINWNGWRDTMACLESLMTQDYPSLTILVVDNASTDDSIARIRAGFPAIEVLQAEKNRGFAAGSNMGIRRAMRGGAEFVWLLNNDTLIPPDSLSKLATAAASDSHIGIVGTVLKYMQEPTKVQAWGGGSISRWMGFVRHDRSPAALDKDSFVTFASVLLRVDMLRHLGLLDEGYFMYFEDADLCFRAQNAGWRLAVAADTAVLHKEGGSAVARKDPRVDRIVTTSGLRFLDRFGKPRGISKVLFIVSRLAKRATLCNVSGMRAVIAGMSDWRRDEPLAFQDEESDKYLGAKAEPGA